MEPAETKVTAATSGAVVSSALVTLLLYALRGWSFVEEMDSEPRAALTIVVTTLVVGGSTFVSGYVARHTYRRPVKPE